MADDGAAESQESLASLESVTSNKRATYGCLSLHPTTVRPSDHAHANARVGRRVASAFVVRPRVTGL
eukprot:6805821-Prymnesium_polylepis.1